MKTVGKYDAAEGKSIYGWVPDAVRMIPGFLTDIITTDLHIGLNYGQATGSAQLLRFVTEHTEVRWLFLSFPLLLVLLFYLRPY